MNYLISIPTYNGGKKWEEAAAAIRKDINEDGRVRVIDSGSTDNTVRIAKEYGFDVLNILKSEFNHGGTRNLAFENIDGVDVVIFLTQDAIPCSGFINNILRCFEDNQVCCAYGRQLPHNDADPIAIHARNFNYPNISHKYSKNDITKYGIKTVFMSNSFSAYRVDIFNKLGRFPSHTILCEDMYFAAKAIEAGYSICYMAEANVRHSHNYTAVDEFKRYFDIGVFHKNEPWIQNLTGGLGGEGKKFVLSEINFVLGKNPLLVIKSIFATCMKLLGLKLGTYYSFLPRCIIKKMSMHKGYWQE